jgi:hypothetical protein
MALSQEVFSFLCSGCDTLYISSGACLAHVEHFKCGPCSAAPSPIPAAIHALLANHDGRRVKATEAEFRQFLEAPTNRPCAALPDLTFKRQFFHWFVRQDETFQAAWADSKALARIPVHVRREVLAQRHKTQTRRAASKEKEKEEADGGEYEDLSVNEEEEEEY